MPEKRGFLPLLPRPPRKAYATRPLPPQLYRILPHALLPRAVARGRQRRQTPLLPSVVFCWLQALLTPEVFSGCVAIGGSRMKPLASAVSIRTPSPALVRSATVSKMLATSTSSPDNRPRLLLMEAGDRLSTYRMPRASLQAFSGSSLRPVALAER